MFPPLPSVSISLRLWLLALFNSVPLSSVTAVFFLRVHPLNSSVSASCELWVGELSQRSLVNSCCLHPCALLLLRLYLSPSVTLKDLSLPQFTPNHRRTHDALPLTGDKVFYSISSDTTRTSQYGSHIKDQFSGKKLDFWFQSEASRPCSPCFMLMHRLMVLMWQLFGQNTLRVEGSSVLHPQRVRLQVSLENHSTSCNLMYLDRGTESDTSRTQTNSSPKILSSASIEGELGTTNRWCQNWNVLRRF